MLWLAWNTTERKGVSAFVQVLTENLHTGLAKQDGRWDKAYDSQRNATVPDDFRQELDKNPGAQEFFATLNSTNRYAILYQIQVAKKPETRARRIEKYITMLNEQKKIY